MQTVTGSILASLSPWNDPAGSWQAINTALASMFETAFDITAAQGTQDCPPVGILSTALTAGSTISSLSTGGVNQAIPAGTLVMVVGAGGFPWQNFTTSAPTVIGGTSIAISPSIVSTAFPINSFVCLGYTAGWSTLLDAVACYNEFPQFLPYLSMFNGVNLPAGTTPSDALSLVQAESGFQRGTPAAIVAAAKRNLTGTQSVILLERTSPLSLAQPYWFLVVVRPEELVSAAALTAAVNAVKPAGVQWQLEIADGFSWFEATGTWNSDLFTWQQAAAGTGGGLTVTQLSGLVSPAGGRIGGSFVLVDTSNGVWQPSGPIPDGTPLLIDGNNTTSLYSGWPSVSAENPKQAFAVPWGSHTFTLGSLSANINAIYCSGPWMGANDIYGVVGPPAGNNPEFFGGATPTTTVYPQTSNNFGQGYGWHSSQGINTAWAATPDPAPATSVTLIVTPGSEPYELPSGITVWSSVVTYSSGQTVQDSNGQVWSSKAGGNLNNNPVTDGGVHWQVPALTKDTRYEYNIPDNYGNGQPWRPISTVSGWTNGVDPIATVRNVLMCYRQDFSFPSTYTAPAVIDLAGNAAWAADLTHRSLTAWSGASATITPSAAQWKANMGTLSNIVEDQGPASFVIASGTSNGTLGSFQNRYQPTGGGNQNLTVVTWDTVDLQNGLGLDTRTSIIVEHQNGLFSTTNGNPWVLTGIPAGWSANLQAQLAFAYNSVNPWNSATTYASGVIVVGSDNNYYTSLAGGNLNHNPVGDGGVHWSASTNGVSWSNTLTYSKNAAVTGSDTNFYLSLINNNTGINPVTDGGSNWAPAQFPPYGPPRDNSGNIIPAGTFGGGYIRTWRDNTGTGAYVCTSAGILDTSGNPLSVPGTPTYDTVGKQVVGQGTYGLDAGKLFGPTLKGNACTLTQAVTAGQTTLSHVSLPAASTGFVNSSLGYGVIVDLVNGSDVITWKGWTQGGGFTGVSGITKSHPSGSYLHGIIEPLELSPGINQGQTLASPDVRRLWPLLIGATVGSVAMPASTLP